jgi:hypothetical protein
MEIPLWQKAGIAFAGVTLVAIAGYLIWLDTTAPTTLPTASEAPTPVVEEETEAAPAIDTFTADDRAAMDALLAFHRSSREMWFQMLTVHEEFDSLCRQNLATLIQKNLVQACHAQAARIISLVDQHDTLIQSTKLHEEAMRTYPHKFDAHAVAWYEALNTDIFRQYHGSVRTFYEKYQANILSVDADIIAENPAEMTSARRAQLEAQIATYNRTFAESTAADEAMQINIERVMLALPR